ncbi:DUF1772 domain-containing protein [Cumulibacter soli]|uniref:anthrone oxygenase family protein n=1 Tax=Cumulibacter soli TaxID=2546344 RepID=UPI001068BEDA|nr:anthrone oxygenase family protein [Cumulibacter soli]
MNAATVDALLVAAVVTNGLLAGLFFAFACAITPALRRVDDRTYVRAFRAINSSILNPVFMVVFLGAPATAIIGAIARVGADVPHSSGWVIAGGILSALTFLITAMANVPLNQGLDRADVDTDAQQHAARETFEARWNRWNLARTLTSALCILSLTMTITAS